MKIVRAELVNKVSFDTLDIKNVIVGEVLVFDIYIKVRNNYIIIIEAGTYMTDKLLLKLQHQNALYISSKDTKKLTLTSESLIDYVMYNKDNQKKSLELLYEVSDKIFNEYLNNQDDKINILGIKAIVKSIIYLIKNKQNYLKNNVSLFESRESISYHSIHVSIYALTIANTINLNYEELNDLGLASMLHDIGHKKIDDNILKKESVLDDKEVKHVHSHVRYSTDIAKHNHITKPYVIDAITHHHELYDGSGYPNNLIDEEIGQFASILAICDVFDALTSDRPHRKAFSTFEALKMMIKDPKISKQFNQHYTKTLLKSFS